MEPHKGHNGDRIDFSDSGNDSGSSVGSASSYVSLLDGVHSGSRVTKGDVKRKSPALWALAFLTFLPIVTLALWGRLSALKLAYRTEQGHVGDVAPASAGSQQPPGKEAPEDTRPRSGKPITMHSPFKYSRKVQELLAWVERSKYAEGGRQDWRSALNQAVLESNETPDILGFIQPEDKFETVLFLRGKQIRLAAVLFDIKKDWNGEEVARELEDKLLRELTNVVEYGFLGRLPSRLISLKAGSSSTGFVFVTINVSREGLQSAPLSPPPKSGESPDDPSENSLMD